MEDDLLAPMTPTEKFLLMLVERLERLESTIEDIHRKIDILYLNKTTEYIQGRLTISKTLLRFRKIGEEFLSDIVTAIEKNESCRLHVDTAWMITSIEDRCVSITISIKLKESFISKKGYESLRCLDIGIPFVTNTWSETSRKTIDSDLEYYKRCATSVDRTLVTFKSKK
jgi:hypothetical protein